MARLDQDALLRLIECSYAAALDPGSWPEFTRELCTTFQAEYTLLFGFEPATSRVLYSHSHRLPAEVLRQYAENYAPLDVRMPTALAAPTGTVLSEGQMLESRAYRRSAIYNEYLEPLGIPHLMAAFPVRTQELGVCLSVNRGAPPGEYSAAELEFAQTLIPHLQRAVLIISKLASASQQRALALESADRLPYGVVWLGRRMQVVGMNSAARAICGARDGLEVRDGELYATRNGDQSRLRRFLDESTTHLRPRQLTHSVARASGAEPYRIMLMPMARPEGLALEWVEAVVFIFDPRRAGIPAAEFLMALFDLTPAEARVAQGVVADRQLREIAAQLRLSIHTVRAHWKRVLTKSGARTQAEFVRRVLTSPAAACSE